MTWRFGACARPALLSSFMLPRTDCSRRSQWDGVGSERGCEYHQNSEYAVRAMLRQHVNGRSCVTLCRSTWRGQPTRGHNADELLARSLVVQGPLARAREGPSSGTDGTRESDTENSLSTLHNHPNPLRATLRVHTCQHAALRNGDSGAAAEYTRPRAS